MIRLIRSGINFIPVSRGRRNVAYASSGYLKLLDDIESIVGKLRKEVENFEEELNKSNRFANAREIEAENWRRYRQGTLGENDSTWNKFRKRLFGE